MYPNLVHQHQNWPSPASGESRTVPFEYSLFGQMCTLINWSVCLCSTWKRLLLKQLEFHLELQKTICYKISKRYPYKLDLGNPNSATNDGITFYLCSYSKLLSPIILHFTKTKPLNCYGKCFLFHLNCSFGSCSIQILEGN